MLAFLPTTILAMSRCAIGWRCELKADIRMGIRGRFENEDARLKIPFPMVANDPNDDSSEKLVAVCRMDGRRSEIEAAIAALTGLARTEAG